MKPKEKTNIQYFFSNSVLKLFFFFFWLRFQIISLNKKFSSITKIFRWDKQALVPISMFVGPVSKNWVWRLSLTNYISQVGFIYCGGHKFSDFYLPYFLLQMLRDSSSYHNSAVVGNSSSKASPLSLGTLRVWRQAQEHPAP